MVSRRGKLTYAGRIVRGLARGQGDETPALPRSGRGLPSRKPKAPRARPPLAVPSSTYRFQFNKDFTFRDAEMLVDYLRDLGISHCYASPKFAAWKDSLHGYDVCSFEQVSAAAGGAAKFLKLACRLTKSGMSLVLDIVPNHMASDCANKWWLDVLEKGLGSPYAHWFD